MNVCVHNCFPGGQKDVLEFAKHREMFYKALVGPRKKAVFSIVVRGVVGTQVRRQRRYQGKHARIWCVAQAAETLALCVAEQGSKIN
jgi:hypothetical protein